MIKSRAAPCNKKITSSYRWSFGAREGPGRCRPGVWRLTITLPTRPSLTRSYSMVVVSPKSLFNSCFTFSRNSGSTGGPAWSMVRGRSVRDETVDMLTQLRESSSCSQRASSKLGEYLGRFANLARFRLQRLAELVWSPSSNVSRLCRFPRVSSFRQSSWHIPRPRSPPR